MSNAAMHTCGCFVMSTKVNGKRQIEYVKPCAEHLEDPEVKQLQAELSVRIMQLSAPAILGVHVHDSLALGDKVGP